MRRRFSADACGQQQVHQRAAGEQWMGIFRQPAVAHFREAEAQLENGEDVLDPGARLALDVVLLALLRVAAQLGAPAPIDPVFGFRRAGADGCRRTLVGLVAPSGVPADRSLSVGWQTSRSPPCSSAGSMRLSATLAAVPTTEWISLVRLSTPTCAFMPKYHWLPLRTWCISGSRPPALFLVDDGACGIVASQDGFGMAPVPSFSPRSAR